MPHPATRNSRINEDQMWPSGVNGFQRELCTVHQWVLVEKIPEVNFFSFCILKGSL